MKYSSEAGGGAREGSMAECRLQETAHGGAQHKCGNTGQMQLKPPLDVLAADAYAQHTRLPHIEPAAGISRQAPAS